MSALALILQPSPAASRTQQVWASNPTSQRAYYRSAWVMRSLQTLLIASLLSGCIHTQPVPEKVYIRVPAPCIEASQLPAPPSAKTDAELAAMTDFDLVINLAADRLEYRRHSNEAAAILKACTR